MSSALNRKKIVKMIVTLRFLRLIRSRSNLALSRRKKKKLFRTIASQVRSQLRRRVKVIKVEPMFKE